MYLIIAVVLFAAYVLHVVIGAFSGASILGDVGEMLVLLVASVAFTVAILRRETDEKAKQAVPSQVAVAAADAGKKSADLQNDSRDK